MEAKPRKHRAPALTLLAALTTISAFLYPAYASLFWLVAAVASLAAAYYAAQLRPQVRKETRSCRPFSSPCSASPSA